MQPESKPLIQATEKTFEQLKDTTGVVMVNFTAQGCQPCRQLEPVLLELSNHWTQPITVAQLDWAANARIADRYRVAHLPTLLVFKDGQLLSRHRQVLPTRILAEEVLRLQSLPANT